jgi:hypothetical protein
MQWLHSDSVVHINLMLAADTGGTAVAWTV